MIDQVDSTAPLEPPVGRDTPGEAGDWFPLPADDPVVQHIAVSLWARPAPPGAWEAARLSAAAFIYREVASGWAVVAKFYAAKTGSDAQKYAAHEHARIQQVRSVGLDGDQMRAVEPLGVWRGVLFLEYAAGLTLEDVIAVRRSRPGTLLPALEQTAAFLARLHARCARPVVAPDFTRPAAKALEVIETLAKHGVLEHEPVIADVLRRLVNRWAGEPRMVDFTPTLIHGDVTTTNFVFPFTGGVIAIDWERAKEADPASDVGRLLAEASHSIIQHGGTPVEALPLLERTVQAYCDAAPPGCNGEVLAKRARFYQAYSTLRIARNGWLSHLTRTALAAQALALLA